MPIRDLEKEKQNKQENTYYNDEEHNFDKDLDDIDFFEIMEDD